MKGTKEKVQLIFIPFLIISVCFLVTYTFLHWLLFIRTSTISIKEDVVDFWIPAALSFLTVIIVLRPRLKLLLFKNDNIYFGFQFLASIAIAAPVITAQHYLETATGKLTSVTDVSQIEKTAPTKYYFIGKYFIDKAHAGFHNSVYVSGKNNDRFNMRIYVAIPVFTRTSDTTQSVCTYWLGAQYSQSISNSLSDAEKDEIYRRFKDDSRRDFHFTEFNQFIYLERMGNTEDRDEYKKAADQTRYIHNQGVIVFTAKNESFNKRNGDNLAWIPGSFLIGSSLGLIMLLFAKPDTTKINQFNKGRRQDNKDLIDMLELLIPKPGYFITTIIVDLNILIYLIMVFAGLGIISFDAIALVRWGGNYGPATNNGEEWRLLTNIFLHGGLMHLIVNMMGLLFAGFFLEPLLGKTRFSIVYIVTGIFASCCSLYYHASKVSIGASGAIFGLYGVFLAFMLLKVYPKGFNKAFLAGTIIFIAYNLLMGLRGGIDNAAHIGGLLSGFIAGVILKNTLKEKPGQADKIVSG